MSIGIFLLLTLLQFESAYGGEKRIAITIDDAPMASSKLLIGTKRTIKIIEGLDTPAAIFVIGENIFSGNGKKRLKMYDDAGHMISNHTYSHYACSKVSEEKFIKDIEKAHELISDYKNFKPLFRYPYLDECDKAEKKTKVRKFLKEKDYINGYVTIVTYDYYINKLLQNAVRQGKKINYLKLKKTYLNIMLGYVEFYYKIYFDKLGYAIPHSLLLHENDLNALYLKDLINFLRDNGWEIISPNDVYKDEKVMNDVNIVRQNLPNIKTLRPHYIDKIFKEVIDKG